MNVRDEHTQQHLSSSDVQYAGAPENTPHDTQTSFLHDIIKYGLIAFIIVFPLRLYVAQPFVVSGASMAPTFHSGEYLIIDQVTYYFEEPERGDVVVFRYPRDPSKFYIKRVIGLPGEIVEIRGREVLIKSDTESERVVLDEFYIPDSNFREDYITTVLGEEEYFMLGDNRKASSDSRVWGAVSSEFIIGKAFLRLLPFSEFALHPGEEDLDIAGETTSTEVSNQ